MLPPAMCFPMELCLFVPVGLVVAFLLYVRFAKVMFRFRTRKERRGGRGFPVIPAPPPDLKDDH